MVGFLQLRLEDGADVNKVMRDGLTALHFAAQRGHAEVLSLLMAYGASLTARTNDGLLPIDVAANEAIRVLIHGPRPQASRHPRPDVEQASKRSRLEGEGEEGAGQATAAAAEAVKTAEELKYEAEVNEDSASSDEEEIDETKIHYRHIAPENKDV